MAFKESKKVLKINYTGTGHGGRAVQVAILKNGLGITIDKQGCHMHIAMPLGKVARWYG